MTTLEEAYAEGRKDEREEWIAPFKSEGRCTCAGPDGPCETCASNQEAYEEWLSERPWSARIKELEALLADLSWSIHVALQPHMGKTARDYSKHRQ